MPKVELRNYRKAKSPFATLMRLFRYFKHCRAIIVAAVITIVVYSAATIGASYCMKPIVNLLKETLPRMRFLQNISPFSSVLRRFTS